MTINQVAISGNVGRADLRRTSSGLPILEFSVAVNEWRKDAEDYVSWISCTVFGDRAEKLNYHLTKGAKVSVSGSLHESRWEDKDGKRCSRVTVKVDQLEFMSAKQEQPQEQPAQHPQAQPQEQQEQAYAQDDIPF